MALVVKDRVRETTTTTGTGTLTLSGAVTGFQSFSNALSNGDTTYYGIFEGSTGNWEVGLGTFTLSGTTLARTTVLASSNSGSAVNLTATADVFITQPATKAAYFDGSGDLVLNQDPTANLQAATKQYVDTIAAAGLHYHDPVRVEQEGNLNATYDNGTSGVGATLTNAGTQAALVIDGVTMVVNDRVLIYEQTNAAHNGVYTVTNVGSASTNWVLTRATDADSYGPSDPDALGQGDAFFVSEGDAGAGETYVMTTEGTITFGTTDITFSQISATQVYSAGNGLTLTGTTFAVGQGTGVTVNANDIAIGQDVGTTADVTFNSVSASLTGNVTGDVTGDLTGNADTATAWATSRTVSLTGDVTGSATGVDGSGNVSIATTIGANSVALGTDTTGNYVQQGATSGNGISGSVNSEGGTFTVTSNATSANTASTTVFRDASGNFSAGTITANLTGTASNAATLDSLDSTQFLRSDASDSTSGVLTSTSTDASGGIQVNTAGTAYFRADRGSTSNSAGYQYATNGTGYWWNYISSTVETLKWYSSASGIDVMTLTEAGSLATNSQGTLWGSSNDGSGSGLDADTVDGLQASSFLRSDAADTATGSIEISTGTSQPLKLTTSNGSPWALEIYRSDLTSSSKVYNNGGYWSFQDNPRFYNGGIQSRLLHTGDEGSGNGLDADTVDGIQASSFLRSDADDSASGDITFTESIEVQSGGGSGNPIRIGSGFGSGGSATIHKYGAALYLQYANGQTSTDVLLGGGGTTANLRMQGGYIDNISSAYVQDYIYHQGDTDTYLGFGTNTITLATGGSSEITVNTTGVRLGDTGNGYFQPVSGNYGSIQIDGGAHGGYEGYSIGGVAVFMTNSSTVAGLYNDANNHWWMRGTFNGTTEIHYQGTSKLQTTSSGINVTGTAEVDTLQFSDGSTQTSAGASTGKAIAMAIVFG